MKNFQIKIGDFGLAKIALMPLMSVSSIAGTPPLIAPEIFQGEKFGKSSDVWSLGCMFYSLLTKTLPFSGKDYKDLENNICHTDPIPLPESFSKDIRGMIYGMMNKSPDFRLTFKQIFKTPFISKILEKPSISEVIENSSNLIEEGMKSIRKVEKNFDDWKFACEKFKNASEIGDFEGQWRYGFCLLTGKGINKNRELGVTILKTSGENGSHEGLYLYSWMCLSQGSQPQIQNLKKLCDKNYAPALWSYASLMEFGMGMEKDIPGSIQMKKRSVKYGTKYQARVITESYRFGGNGFPQSDSEADRYQAIYETKEISEIDWFWEQY